MSSNDDRVPITACRGCGKKLDGATVVTAPDSPPPKPGDISICLYCATISAYTPTLQLRALTPAELREVFTDRRFRQTLAAVTHRILEIN